MTDGTRPENDHDDEASTAPPADLDPAENPSNPDLVGDGSDEPAENHDD
jgi:hypothetical protein